jgi:hypothetical protein
MSEERENSGGGGAELSASQKLRILWDDLQYRRRRDIEEAKKTEDRRRQLQAWLSIPGGVVGFITAATILWPTIVKLFR